MILGASGVNFYPEEIEAALNASPFVLESLVYGDEKALTALVHLKPEALLEYAAARVMDGIENAEVGAAERSAAHLLETSSASSIRRAARNSSGIEPFH
jgi:long-chain acyl-CoA synthetase